MTQREVTHNLNPKGSLKNSPNEENEEKPSRPARRSDAIRYILETQPVYKVG